MNGMYEELLEKLRKNNRMSGWTHIDRLIDEAAEAIEALKAENEQLQELAKAKADGRLVVLPCKVGDTVYQLRSKRHAHGKGISPRIVSCVVIYADGDYALSHQGMTDCIKKELGKTWFLTREAAEKALEVRE